MLTVKTFTFNPYQENTYVVSDASKACVIIDPGCYEERERQALTTYIQSEGLKVESLLNTHGHIDHMLGNRFVKDTYQVPFITHQKVIKELADVGSYGLAMGFQVEPSPDPDQLVVEGDKITFGESELAVLFTPGHSAGHISFYHAPTQELFSGDVLFQGSIGRTDLPGGSYEVLMESILTKLLALPDDVKVYCGHGPATTIGNERNRNPFILDYQIRNKG